MLHALVVDDEASIRFALRLALEDQGFLVEEAADGRTGLTCIEQSATPLVVLLDVMMPRLDGLGVLAALFQQPLVLARHRVILLSAASSTLPLAIVQQMTSHRIRFVPKPFDVFAVVALAEALAQELSSPA